MSSITKVHTSLTSVSDTLGTLRRIVGNESWSQIFGQVRTHLHSSSASAAAATASVFSFKLWQLKWCPCERYDYYSLTHRLQGVRMPDSMKNTASYGVTDT